HYKVQYLDAATRYPINPENADIIKDSTHASVKEDALIIPGYIARESSQTMVLTASTESDPAAQESEEIRNNVITFLYDINTTDYLYEVEYYTQNVNDNNYSLYNKETLTTTIIEGDDTTVSIAALRNRAIPAMLSENGYVFKANSVTYTTTDSNGTSAPASVADNGYITLVDSNKKTVQIYFDRRTYPYSYVYVDHIQEKVYNDTPAAERGDMWDGIIATYNNAGTGRTDQEVTINPAEFTTYTSGGNTTDYVRIGGSSVSLTIQPVPPAQPDVNKIKIYYRKDTERELEYEMVCVNNNSDTDYDRTTGEPLFGRLSVTMQTVEDYNAIQSVQFFNNNDETDDNGDYLHLHKYKFLGWYSTRTYDPEHPERNRLTTNTTLTKADLGTNGELPVRDTEYYALVEQVMVKMDVMFCCIDNYTVDSLRAEDNDAALKAIIQSAKNNDELYSSGERVGEDVTFSNPTSYKNHAEVPWHRNDGYSLHMESIDNRVYKYGFAEWWEITIDENDQEQYVRHENWNNSIGWDPSSLSNQLARNRNQYLIAVYARRPVTEMPYTIKYNFKTRISGVKDFVVKGTLNSEQLTEGGENSAINNAGAYELTNEFVLNSAPYEANHGETLTWTDEKIVKTSYKGSGNTVDRIETTVTAEQKVKNIYIHYRTSPADDYSTIATTFGANYKEDPQLLAIDVQNNTYNGQEFSYWEIRSKENGEVITCCYNRLFDFCIMDSYFITPVFEGATSAQQHNPDTVSVKLRHLDYARNRWTDDEGNLIGNGNSDLLFSDFELTFYSNNDNIFGSSKYKTGMVFEICAQLKDNQTFTHGRDYGFVSDENKLKQAILNKSTNYYYEEGKGNEGKRRTIQVNEISTSKLSSKNRIDYSKCLLNSYKESNGVKSYTNKTYVLKATAYLIDENNNVTLSNSEYICMSDIAAQDLATSGGVCTCIRYE
nr:hypothetical protein [Ruminococcus sp.]